MSSMERDSFGSEEAESGLWQSAMSVAGGAGRIVLQPVLGILPKPLDRRIEERQARDSAMEAHVAEALAGMGVTLPPKNQV